MPTQHIYIHRKNYLALKDEHNMSKLVNQLLEDYYAKLKPEGKTLIELKDLYKERLEQARAIENEMQKVANEEKNKRQSEENREKDEIERKKISDFVMNMTKEQQQERINSGLSAGEYARGKLNL